MFTFFPAVMQDVRELGSNATVLHVSSFLGLVLPLLDNPHHKAELFSMGLHPANAFACGIDFLLRLRPEALAPFEKEFQARFRPCQRVSLSVPLENCPWSAASAFCWPACRPRRSCHLYE